MEFFSNLLKSIPNPSFIKEGQLDTTTLLFLLDKGGGPRSGGGFGNAKGRGICNRRKLKLFIIKFAINIFLLITLRIYCIRNYNDI
jgi:hypothetical protein